MVNGFESFKDRDIKKHKNDVFRLTLMFRDDDELFELPETIKKNFKNFKTLNKAGVFIVHLKEYGMEVRLSRLFNC